MHMRITVFITQPLPRPLMRTPPPFQYTEAGLHSACSCSQARATVESVFSLGPLLQRWRVREPCASQLWPCWWFLPLQYNQVSITYLTASICTCTYTQWFVSVQIAYKVKQLVTLKFVFLLHVIHCVVLFFISSCMRTTAVMLAADCCARHGYEARFAP